MRITAISIITSTSFDHLTVGWVTVHLLKTLSMSTTLD